MAKSETLVITGKKKTEINKRVVEASLDDKLHTKELSN